jgi:hypothetical protein
MAYHANARAFGIADNGSGGVLWDPNVPGFTGGYPMRHLSSIKRSAEVAFMWDTSCQIGGGTNYGAFYGFSFSIDNYAASTGTPSENGMCYPNPPTGSSYTALDYSNQVALGCPVTAGSNVGSQIAGSITPSYLKAANQDYTTTTFNGPGGRDIADMRFRHLNDTACNILFGDMHVDSRMIGTVVAKDICMNPK